VKALRKKITQINHGIIQMTRPTITVTGLHIYPVKSMGGISLSEADLGQRGFKYDREWLLIDKDNRFVSQREIARMSLISTIIDEDRQLLLLSLPSADGAQTLEISLQHALDAPQVRATVWSDKTRATLESDNSNKQLSKFLGADVRLVRMAEGYKRRVDGRYATSKEDIVGFADGFPFLFISEESLEDLNNKLEYPVPMNRFRPNITIRGGGAFAEDDWNKIKIAGVQFEIVKPCARCVITTIDQDSAVSEKEPLRTLANFRKKQGRILFGQNAVFSGTGKIKIGDTVTVYDD